MTTETLVKQVTGVHVIVKEQNLSSIKLIDRAANLYSCGTWVISRDIAENMIGNDFYVHNSQNEGAFHGGVVVDVVLEESGRYTFFYKARQSHRGVKTTGWSQEKAYRYE